MRAEPDEKAAMRWFFRGALVGRPKVSRLVALPKRSRMPYCRGIGSWFASAWTILDSTTPQVRWGPVAESVVKRHRSMAWRCWLALLVP